MPAFGTITINDGAATPVAHNFVPMSLDQSKNLAVLADRAGGIAIGFNQLTMTLRPPVPAKAGSQSTSERIYRIGFTVSAPTLETLGNNSGGLTPPPTVAYVPRVNIEFLLPERCTQQNRKDILAYAKNLLAHATITSMVQDLEAVY